MKELGRRHGLQLSIEPYDLNPTADLNLGSAADVPMCEFWSKGHGFSTEYSCLEAVSIGHTGGAKIIAAESFTADHTDTWLQYPTSMKAQTDWALATGINRLVFHRYQHQPRSDQFPGMTMGPYGVHWERTETWWDMVPAYHKYLARCQQMLRRGLPVADILYLTPEGAPHVFRPPASATTGNPPDRRGYNFDGISPDVFIKTATVVGRPDCLSRRHDVPRIGPAPLRNDDSGPAGKDQGACCRLARRLSARRRSAAPACPAIPSAITRSAAWRPSLWGTAAEARRTVGKGTVVRPQATADLYPAYEVTEQILSKMDLQPDFTASEGLRYTHRHDGDDDIYFVANCRNEPQSASCHFRAQDRRLAEWWDPVTGQRFALHPVTVSPRPFDMPTSWFYLKFAPYQSAFIVFRTTESATPLPPRPEGQLRPLTDLAGPWEVSFDPRWGGPERIVFEKLVDWTQRPEEGIRHYSGKAVYRKRFDLSAEVLKHAKGDFRLALGTVHDMASVKLNGRDLSVVWCDPWEVELPPEALREHGNELEITVANRWPNRIIGDLALPPEKRRTKTTYNPFHKKSPLLPSGLIGPVQVMASW